MLLFYGVVGAQIFTGALGLWAALVFLSIPRLVQVLRLFGRPPPEHPPKNYPVWPLWYVSAAFVLTRQAGAFFAAGLLLQALYPLSL